MDEIILMYTYCHLYIYHENCMCIALFDPPPQKKTLVYRGVLKYAMNTHDS